MGLETGNKAIGLIEAFFALVWIANIFVAPEFALCMFFLYSLPFLVCYIASFMAKDESESLAAAKRYRWVTRTVKVYRARLILFVIVGLTVMIYASCKNEFVEYFCDMYTETRFEMMAKLQRKKSLTLSEKETRD